MIHDARAAVKGDFPRGPGTVEPDEPVFMDHDPYSLLRCPRCRGRLETTPEFLAEPEALICKECEARYPVLNGIPRLAGEGYSASFGRQWNRYDVQRLEEDDATFRVKTGIDPVDLRGKLVLDAGCGGGHTRRSPGDTGRT